jgi:glycosyltransferase involved in cell wall biosynthesis
MIKVLYTTPILEHPPAGGPQLRIENSIKALGRNCELHVVSRRNCIDIGGQDAEQYFSNLCQGFSYSPSCRRSFNSRYLRKIQILLDNLTQYNAIRDASFILEIVDRIGISVIWFGYGNISYQLIRAIRERRPDIKIVCDTDSVWSRFILREVPHISNIFRRAFVRIKGGCKEKEEKRLVQLSNVTTAVSEVDANYYQSISAYPERIHLFSNVIDLHDYSVIPSPPPLMRKPCMFLAGTFGGRNSSMNIAAKWVLEEVFPLVKSRLPDLHFYIVGKGSQIALNNVASPSVSVVGKLPSVLPYLCHADVSIVPLKFESGTRFKILEAAVCRVPIVSTTLGAEGLPVEDGKHLLIADEAAQFADAILELIHNKSKMEHLVENCFRLIQQEYSVECLENEAKKILKYLER